MTKNPPANSDSRTEANIHINITEVHVPTDDATCSEIEVDLENILINYFNSPNFSIELDKNEYDFSTGTVTATIHKPR